MGNSNFSIRYLAQEILKIVFVFIIIGFLERMLKVRGVAIFLFTIAIFFTSHKLICIVKYIRSDKDFDLEKVKFTWRFKGKKGVKLSKEVIERNCRNESNFNPAVIFLLGFGVITNSLVSVIAVLVAMQLVYPATFDFLDKNFDNYYKFRGVCTGVITIDPGRSGKEYYFVSIVDYKTKQELVVKVDYEKMSTFKNGQIIDVIYGRVGKNAISIY